MIDLAELEKAGVTVRQYCGLDAEEGVGCSEEAVGEVIAQLEDDVQIPVPVCQGHLDLIRSEFNIEDV